MTVTLKRQLSESEKDYVLQKHGRKCFATGHPIAEDQTVNFDHIQSFAAGGISEIDNIAPMCEVHNKQKGTLRLEDFRIKLRLEEFFSAGDKQTLKHLLEFLKQKKDLKTFGAQIISHHANGQIIVEEGSQKHTYALYKCPTTGWQYFYATLPVDWLNSDDDEDQQIGLQPRYLLKDRVFELYRHFQNHPVLQPSIGRIHQNRVLLFDGQHKIAALLWTGRREFECKVYLAPDLKLLNETNISAHDKFSQVRFFSSIMVTKLGAEFGSDFEKYKNIEDGAIKSEAGFLKFLERNPEFPMTKADINKRFRSYLYTSALQPELNRLSKFVSSGNRGTDQTPLTIDVLTNSIFACFLYREPLNDNLASDFCMRDKEIENLINLMNVLHDQALSSWNPSAGPNDGHQRKLERIFRSKSMMAWSELLRDAICGKLELQDAEERARPLYRELNQKDLDRVNKVIDRLLNWKLWSSPIESEVDRVLSDNKSAVKDWFRNNGLTTGYLSGAPE